MNIIESVSHLSVVPWVENSLIAVIAIVAIGLVYDLVKAQSKEDRALKIGNALLWLIPLVSMLIGFERNHQQAWYAGVIWLGIFIVMSRTCPINTLIAIIDKAEDKFKKKVQEPEPATEPATEPEPVPEPNTAQESESTPEDVPASEDELKDLENAFKK